MCSNCGNFLLGRSLTLFVLYFCWNCNRATIWIESTSCWLFILIKNASTYHSSQQYILINECSFQAQVLTVRSQMPLEFLVECIDSVIRNKYLYISFNRQSTLIVWMSFSFAKKLLSITLSIDWSSHKQDCVACCYLMCCHCCYFLVY